MVDLYLKKKLNN